jgi:glyoxylase-like metal-dependent hydrolase (beta-lactamase superfamily II)
MALAVVLVVLIIVARFGQDSHSRTRLAGNAKSTSNMKNIDNDIKSTSSINNVGSNTKNVRNAKNGTKCESNTKSIDDIKTSSVKNKTTSNNAVTNGNVNNPDIDKQRKRMKVKTIPVGPLETNCYMVMEDREENAAAIVIDPGDDGQEIMDVIQRYNADVKYIVITHAHWDHIGDVSQIAARTGAKVLAHPLDIPALNKPSSNLASLIGEIQRENIKVDKEINDGDIIEFGDLKAQVLHTPGHSRGSVSILIDDALFTGDLIFYRSIGRTDFEGGSLEALRKSVTEKVFPLPGATIIYPGHGPASTVGDERMSNPYFD